jgi:hypothetical protein
MRTETKLSPDKTWIPVGVAVAGLCSFVVGAFWVGLAYQRILSNQDVQGETLTRLERKLDGLGSEFMSKKDFEIFVESLRAGNPDLNVPKMMR